MFPKKFHILELRHRHPPAERRRAVKCRPPGALSPENRLARFMFLRREVARWHQLPSSCRQGLARALNALPRVLGRSVAPAAGLCAAVGKQPRDRHATERPSSVFPDATDATSAMLSSPAPHRSDHRHRVTHFPSSQVDGRGAPRRGRGSWQRLRIVPVFRLRCPITRRIREKLPDVSCAPTYHPAPQ